MDEPTTPQGGEAAGRERFRARLAGVRTARRRWPLGLPELAALSVSALLLLAALGAHFLLLNPQRTRLEELGAERDRLGRQLADAHSQVKTNQDTQSSVRDIRESLTAFEEGHLGGGVHGSTAVVEELNRLIRRNSLSISGGLNFTPLEELAQGAQQQPGQQQPTARRAGKVVQSVYPGIGISLTVEGSYPNLRRFIREVEASRQFIVIDAVELEGVTDPNAPAPSGLGEAPGSAAPTGAARGTVVSLRLDMAAYFRRAGAAPPAVVPGAR